MNQSKKKKYKVGMYGGKFMPFHKGHLYCTEYASNMCEKLYVLLFYGGDQELKAQKDMNYPNWLTPKNRFESAKRACKKYSNVEVHAIDITNCKYPNGTEDWDQETELVLNICGKMDAVFASEPDYKEYFDRAYPWATYEIIDVERKAVPISGTKIRNMKESKERKKWIV